MASADEILFAWAYRVGSREFVIEIFPNGECVLFDETIRRQLCHAGKGGRSILLEEIAADAPSPEQARKAEFGVEFTIDAPHLRLIHQARTEFDRTDDVSAELEAQINRLFDHIFVDQVEPYLTVPLNE
jgi:hypothetical protein